VKLTEESETIFETGNLCISSLLKEVHSFIGGSPATSLELPGSGGVAFVSLSIPPLSGSKKSAFPSSTTVLT